jgi:hypothetical protein
MYAVLILSPLPSVIPFGEKKMKYNTRRRRKKLLEVFESAPPLIAGI